MKISSTKVPFFIACISVLLSNCSENNIPTSAEVASQNIITLKNLVNKLMPEVESIRGKTFTDSLFVSVKLRSEYGQMIQEDSSTNEVLKNASNWLQYENQLGFFMKSDNITSFEKVFQDFSTSLPIAYYVPHTDSLYVVMERNSRRELNGMMENYYLETVLAHEMTHALQDQTLRAFDSLDTFNDASTDEILAFRSLIEGDAEFTSVLFYVYKINGPYSNWQRITKDFSSDVKSNFYQRIYETESYPLEFMLSSYAPYELGYAYIGNYYNANDWNDVNEKYLSYPKSMRSIIEYHFEGKTTFDFSTFSSLMDTTNFYVSDILGSIELLSILGRVPPKSDAITISQSLKGDRISYWIPKNSKQGSFIWAMNFETPFDVSMASNLLNNIIGNKDNLYVRDQRSKNDEITFGAGSYIVYTRDSLKTILVKNGTSLWWIENVKASPDEIVTKIFNESLLSKRKLTQFNIHNAVGKVRKWYPIYR